MKNLKFQILLLFSFLIGVQTLNAQIIHNVDNQCFSMKIVEVEPDAEDRYCVSITVKAKNLQDGEKLVVIDTTNSSEKECLSGDCTFPMCFDKEPGPDFQEVWLACLIENVIRGNTYCLDGCTIMIEPR